MDVPRFYKASALPTSPTAADDGVYFVRPNPSVGYVCYIITNGVAVQQDAATTAALLAITGVLSNLTTTDKTNLVSAINEVNSNSSKRISTVINQGNNWYRIAKGTVSGGSGCSFIIIVERVFSNTNNESYTFSVNTARDGKTTITQLSGTYNIRILTHLRVVNTIADGIHVDIKYNDTLSNPLYVRVLGSGEAISATIAPEVTTGVTELETTTGVRTTDNIFADNRVGSVNGFEILGRTNSDIVLAGGGHRPVSDFALSSQITDNNYLYSIITTNGTTAGTIYTFKRVGLSDLTLTLTAASASFSGVVTTGTQTFDGVKTFLKSPKVPVAVNNDEAVNKGQLDAVGDFRDYGLGTNAIQKTGSYNDISENAFIYGAILTDGPVNTGLAQMGLHIQYDNIRKFQIISRTGGSELYFRNSHINGWSAWFQFYHTGNFNPAQYVLQSALNTQLANYALLSQVYTQSQSLALFVGLNGVQTIADTKTFTSSPIVPTGTLAGHSVNLGQVTTLLNDKVDKVPGKQLSTEDYTSAEKTKLTNIQAGAKVNVNADWNATSGDAQILNKPTIPVIPNNLVTTNTTQTISATKDFTVSPVVPYASDSEHPVPFLQMQEYIANRLDAISSYSRNVINTNDSTIGVKEWIKTIVFATSATGTIINPEETLKNGAILNICTQAITAGSIDVNLPVRRLDGSNVSVYSFAQSKSYIFYYNDSYNRWDETHAINNS